jgi:hypothetical protein
LFIWTLHISCFLDAHPLECLHLAWSAESIERSKLSLGWMCACHPNYMENVNRRTAIEAHHEGETLLEKTKPKRSRSVA